MQELRREQAANKDAAIADMGSRLRKMEENHAGSGLVRETSPTGESVKKFIKADGSIALTTKSVSVVNRVARRSLSPHNETHIPSASEKSSVANSTPTTRAKSAASTPPRSNGTAITVRK